MNRWTELLGPSALLIREGESLSFPVSLEVRTLNLIVDNLLDNARKFARERPEVVIRTRLIHPNSPKKHGKKPTGWQIEIEDHGWGFDPAHSKKIFGRFIRARSLAPYAIPGTGLGLYLAQTASKALRLKLTAESQGNGQGAKFTLEGGRIL